MLGSAIEGATCQVPVVSEGREDDANLVELVAAKPATGLWAVASSISRVIDAISGFFGKISQALVFVVFLVGILNVILRYVGRGMGKQLTSNLWIEGQWYLFALIALSGLAYGLRDGVNPRVDFWYADFSPKKKALVDLAFHGFLLAFSIVAIRVTYDFVKRSWEQREGSPDPDGLARYPLKAALLLAFALFLL
jgi:TRAP-type mannitol/chloroaromatic compound transport system permease small subunit